MYTSDTNMQDKTVTAGVTDGKLAFNYLSTVTTGDTQLHLNTPHACLTAEPNN